MTLDPTALELGRKIGAVTFPASEPMPDAILESLGRIAYKECFPVVLERLRDMPEHAVDAYDEVAIEADGPPAQFSHFAFNKLIDALSSPR